jgi:GcrA cell cycle regulator
MSWTDDRVDVLKKMWGEGQSASQIAKELGGVTRNAVIGAVARRYLGNQAPSVEELKAAAATMAAHDEAPCAPTAGVERPAGHWRHSTCGKRPPTTVL